MSLGYLIHQCGSQKALEYLTTRMAPPVLPALTGLAATDPAATTPPGGNLSKYAVLSLALSGYPKTAEALKAEALKAFQDQEPEPVVTELSVWAALTTRPGVSASGTGVGDTLMLPDRRGPERPWRGRREGLGGILSRVIAMNRPGSR